MELETSVYFKTTTKVKNRFNSNIAILGLKNKDVLNAFLEKFNNFPEKTMEFLEIQK